MLIQNDGPRILATDYWQSEHALHGYYHLSINAGAFRLLVPQSRLPDVQEFRTAREVVISRGPWPAQGKRDGIEVMFEDDSDAPYALHLVVEQLDRLPADSDQGREFRFLVYGPGCELLLELPAYYRRAGRLPCLEPREKKGAGE